METFTSSNDSDFVPSTPDNQQLNASSAFTKYRTPGNQQVDFSGSSDEESYELPKGHFQTSSSESSQVAVVEESDLDGTPVSFGQKFHSNLQYLSDSSKNESFNPEDDIQQSPFSSASKSPSINLSTSSRRESDSPVLVRRNTVRNIIDSDSDEDSNSKSNDHSTSPEEVFNEEPTVPEEKHSQSGNESVEEVEHIPSPSRNISTVSIESTSSGASKDDDHVTEVSSSASPETSNNDSVVEISSPSENVPPAPDMRKHLSELRRSLDSKRSILKSINPRMLPDGGAKIKEQIRQLEDALEKAEQLNSINSQSKSTSNVPQNPAPEARASQHLNAEILRQQLQMKKWALGNATGDQRSQIRADIAAMERQLNEMSISSLKTYSRVPLVNKEPAVKLLPEAERLSEIRRMYAEQPVDRQLYAKGRQTAAQKREAVSVTLDALQNLHSSLATCPTERDMEPTPDSLAVPLLPHQTRALKWLLWRENQIPSGGILADDMGLGKTLTMISLIVKQRELGQGTSDVSDVWLSKELKIKKTSSTLIVCPASVIGQWDNEIQRRTKRGTLSVLTYHGPDRHKYASKLHKSNVVLTTYQIITREISNLAVEKGDDLGPIGDFNEDTHAKEIRQSPLLQVAWERIILDEAHTIRNPKAQVSQAVCRLRAARRWVVTGTPVQNKELDMYSLLRFLRVSPFDQLPVWKRWVDCKSAQGTERLNLLIKTLLLRRTKDQKMEDTGVPIVKMPSREMHTHQIKLSKEENEVYQKILDFSRKALEQYIKTQEKKSKDDWAYDERKSDQKAARIPKDMTKQHLLVLLLRLRQACSHPALIKTMLDTTDETIDPEAKVDESDDLDLISQLESMKIDESKTDDAKEEKNFFSLTNPVFKATNLSSKMSNVIEEVQRVIGQGQKAVIVSQWTSMLDVFEVHFKQLHIRCHRIAGNVTVKQRTAYVEDFNSNPKGPPVMLLSLAAGGVGLNLIGGNHLFLTDMHWNPQLEAQACDRVYRVGQIKDVHVHRFITVGTVEERIIELQKRKLELASGILTGAQNVAAKGLTLEDLKLLFNPSPTPRLVHPLNM